jgi:phosphoglycolate phosphatase-like HAD superfamily hydrolase
MAQKNDLPPAVIFDFDGTFCDVRPILHLLDRSDRHLKAFHEATHLAPENKNVFDLHAEVKEAGITDILISVRGEMWRGVTTSWLAQRDYEPEYFHMRRDDDMRPHPEVKREIIAGIKQEWNILAAVDDDPKNIVMFEEEGIPAILVPGYNGTDEPSSMVIPQWWNDVVRYHTPEPSLVPSLPVPTRAEIVVSGSLCQQPVRSAQNAPCILNAPHRGNCRSKK